MFRIRRYLLPSPQHGLTMTVRALYFTSLDTLLNCLDFIRTGYSGLCLYDTKKSFRYRKVVVVVAPTPGVAIVQVETPQIEVGLLSQGWTLPLCVNIM